MGGIHHLVSRGLEVAVQQAGKNREEFKLEIPVWLSAALAATVAFFLLSHLSVNYAFGLLVPTLTVVEAPSTTATVVRTVERYSDDDSADAPLLNKEEQESQKISKDEEVLIVEHKPLTGKLRTIMRHLRQQTGSKHSHWRGVGGYIFYNIATLFVLNLARNIVPFRLCSHLLHIPVAGLLCVLNAAWIQQMVAMPGKTYFQRVSELSAAGGFRKLVLPVMAVEIVELATLMLPRQLGILFGFAADMKSDDRASAGIMAVGVVLAITTFVVSVFMVVIPLNIGLVRLQASMLSEETETVIPLDRTLGGAEKKGLKSAWRSFSREGCRRLAKNLIKYVMVMFTLNMAFAITVAAQLYLAFGSDAVKVVRKQAEHAHHMMI